MKKMAIFAGFALLAAASFGGMINRNFLFDVAGTNTVEKTATIRGDVATISVEVPDGATGTVSVVTATGETLLNKSGLAASATYHPIVQGCGNNGTAVSNQYQRPAVSGPVTVTVTGTGTNTVTYKVGVIFEN